MDETAALETVKSYLTAFEGRDLARCLEYFREDAEIDFRMAVYRGKQEIEQWHKDRFDADLRLIKLEGMALEGDTVIVEALITSKKIKAWKLSNLSGEVSVKLNGNLFQSAAFRLRAMPW